METQVRKRYFQFRRASLAQLSQTDLNSQQNLDLIGVPYETTGKGRAPMIGSAIRRRSKAVTAVENVDPLAMQAFRYEASIAGAAPVFGSTPLKGNGPVKLQTCRRLSSGELLVVSQDHDRTLSDIREGEYIIGKKEQRGVSRAVSIKRNVKASAPSLRSLSIAAPASPASPANKDKTARSNSSPAVQAHKESRRSSARPSSPGSFVSTSGGAKAFILGPADVPLPDSPLKSPSHRASLASKAGEPSPTIQALFKAEHVRLVAMYGKNGVEKNLTELSKARNDKKTRPGHGKRESVSSRRPTPQQSPLTSNPPIITKSIYLPMRHINAADSESDRASDSVPSLISEESSSSHSKDASISDNEATREEVSRIVEIMRKNYLHAVEANYAGQNIGKRRSKAPKRASYVQAATSSSTSSTSSTSTITPASTQARYSKAGRRSWHAGPAGNASQQDKTSKVRSGARTKIVRDSTPGALRTISSSKHASHSKGPIHRADSTTLGNFVVSQQDVPAMPANASRLKALNHKNSGTVIRVSQVQPPTPPPMVIEPPSSRRSIETIAPEIEDLNIFYQEVTKDMLPVPSIAKPRPTVWDSDIGIASGEGFPDSAPPPPDIDWSRRNRHLVTAL